MADDLPNGWLRYGDWYHRAVTAGPLLLRIDAWPVDTNEWAFSINNGKYERLYASSLSKALLAVDSLVVSYLRTAVRSLVSKHPPVTRLS